MDTQLTSRDKPEKKIYCAVSVDGDLRVGSPTQQKDGIGAMRQAHKDLGLIGRTSWLINEYDFNWTSLYPDVLLDLAASRECIGIHDHLDTQYLENGPYERIYTFLSSTRSRMREFFIGSGIDVAISVHRNGCCLQSRDIYKALEPLDYTILSDVWPGMRWHSRMLPVEHPVQHWRSLEDENDPGSIFTDNSQVPLTAFPWRHDPDNWLDANSRSGRFLQAPITCLPWVNRERVQSAVKSSGQKVFLVVDTHPYNLQNPDTGEVSAELVNDYCNSLAWIRDTYKAEFIRIDQIPQFI